MLKLQEAEQFVSSVNERRIKMNRDYIDESMIMPIATNTFKLCNEWHLIFSNSKGNSTIMAEMPVRSRCGIGSTSYLLGA